MGSHAAVDKRVAVRALRSAAAFGIDAAAAAAGVAPRALHVQLGRLQPRGGCAAAAAHTARKSRGGKQFRALQHPACPPPAVAAAERSVKARTAGSGTAAWASKTAALSFHTRNTQREALRSIMYAPPPVSGGLPDGLAPAILSHAVSCEYRQNLAAVARYPSCPPAVLACLTAHDETVVRMQAAAHPRCPQYLLTVLASDTNRHVRTCLARNPSCPPRVLAGLALDDDLKVRAAVTENPAYRHILRSVDDL